MVTSLSLQKNILGYTLYKWQATSYESARAARMKIEQELGNGEKKTAYITITQTPYAERIYSTTFYQFGRKDAFPGVDVDKLYGGTIVKNAW